MIRASETQRYLARYLPKLLEKHLLIVLDAEILTPELEQNGFATGHMTGVCVSIPYLNHYSFTTTCYLGIFHTITLHLCLLT